MCTDRHEMMWHLVSTVAKIVYDYHFVSTVNLNVGSKIHLNA